MAILRKGNLIGVCIHHSAVKPAARNITELRARATTYNRGHAKKEWAETIKTKGEFGFPYIEYHYMIASDGSLLQVQDEKYVLYHAGDSFRGNDSFNLHGIAIMIDGNYQEEKPNDKQMLTIVKLIRDIQTKYKIDARVRGHKETSKTATACPGLNIGTSKSGWLKQVITNVNDKNYGVEKKPTELELLKSQLKVLTANYDKLSRTNETITNDNKLLIDRNEKLEADVKEAVGLQSKLDDITAKAAKCAVDLKNARQDLAECRAQLDKLQTVNGLLSALIRKLVEWLKKVKEAE